MAVKGCTLMHISLHLPTYKPNKGQLSSVFFLHPKIEKTFKEHKWVLQEIIHVDQTGFMPKKGTNINIRRLFLNLSVSHTNSRRRVFASLDTEKAFNLVKLNFLWETLHRVDFAPKFLQLWICYIVHPKPEYSAPKALDSRLRLN